MNASHTHPCTFKRQLLDSVSFRLAITVDRWNVSLDNLGEQAFGRQGEQDFASTLHVQSQRIDSIIASNRSSRLANRGNTALDPVISSQSQDIKSNVMRKNSLLRFLTHQFIEQLGGVVQTILIYTFKARREGRGICHAIPQNVRWTGIGATFECDRTGRVQQIVKVQVSTLKAIVVNANIIRRAADCWRQPPTHDLLVLTPTDHPTWCQQVATTVAATAEGCC